MRAASARRTTILGRARPAAAQPAAIVAGRDVGHAGQSGEGHEAGAPASVSPSRGRASRLSAELEAGSGSAGHLVPGPQSPSSCTAATGITARAAILTCPSRTRSSGLASSSSIRSATRAKRRQLEEAHWHVFEVWECDIRDRLGGVVVEISTTLSTPPSLLQRDQLPWQRAPSAAAMRDRSRG